MQQLDNTLIQRRVRVPVRSTPVIPLPLALLTQARAILLVIVLGGIGCLSLGYWWTVKTQQDWALGYQQLQQLTQQRRDLEHTTAILEAQLTQGSHPTLVVPRPDQFLVLTSSPAEVVTPAPAPPLPLPQSPPLAY